MCFTIGPPGLLCLQIPANCRQFEEFWGVLAGDPVRTGRKNKLRAQRLLV